MVDLAAENIKIMKAVYDVYVASKGQNIDLLLSYLGEDTRWSSIGSNGVAKFLRDHHGPDDVRAYFRDLYQDWEMERYDVTEYVAQDDRVIVLGEVAFRHKLTGRHVETKKADIWRLEGGRIMEFFEFFDTAAIEAAATP